MKAYLGLLQSVSRKAVLLNRAQSGEALVPEQSSFKVSALVEEVELLASGMPSQPAVRVDVGADPAISASIISADRGWLVMMLVNLLSNAFKHVRRGSVSVRISTDDAGRLRLAVADTGSGVPESLRPRLFTRYAQASQFRFGTGLGLYHVHQIVRYV